MFRRWLRILDESNRPFNIEGAQAPVPFSFAYIPSFDHGATRSGLARVQVFMAQPEVWRLQLPPIEPR